MSIDAITTAQFRADFPEFPVCPRYNEAMVSFWLSVAVRMINGDRWGDMATLGAELFAAHNIVLEAKAQLDMAYGKIPGLSSGIMTNKSVDKVSAGYSTNGVMEPGAGHWNLTIYGQRYARFVSMFGAGPVQIGVPNASTPVAPWMPYI